MPIRVKEFWMDYEDEGANVPPLLLIHAFPMNSQMWAPQINALSPVVRVTAPDLRGFGGTEPMPGPYSVDELADDCRALLDNLGVKEPVVVGGLSMGGYIAFAFYRLFPERTAALVLAATRATADSPEGKQNRNKMIETAEVEGPHAISQAMLPKMLAPQTYQENPKLVETVREIMESNSVEGVIGALYALRDRPDSTPLLPQIHCPALILHGTEDQLIPLSEAEAMQSGIQGSSLRVIPNSGHLLNMEQPDLFNQAVHRFIREL
jgi:pimeloyl-ACP methyl ester carboxylesterase